MKRLEKHSKDIHELVASHISDHTKPELNTPLDEFVKTTLHDLHLASKATLDEIDLVKESIQRLEDCIDENSIQCAISNRTNDFRNDTNMKDSDRSEMETFFQDISSHSQYYQ